MVPNVKVMLAFTTALTIPIIAQIYPVVLYWTLFGLGDEARSLGASLASRSTTGRGGVRRLVAPGSPKMFRRDKSAASLIFAVGCICVAVCSVAAFGRLSIAELRGVSQIGCPGWIIYKG